MNIFLRLYFTSERKINLPYVIINSYKVLKSKRLFVTYLYNNHQNIKIMRNHFSFQSFFRILWVLLIVWLINGCQKEVLEPETANTPVNPALKSAKTMNYIVLTTSESIPAGFEKQLTAYGKVVKILPEIGMMIVKP